MKVKEVTAKMKYNVLGTVIGGIGAFVIAKKVVKAENNWVIAAIVIVGAVGGAIVSSNIKAKKSVPTKEVIIQK